MDISRYVEMWTYVNDFNVKRWKESWEWFNGVKEEYYNLYNRKWSIMDMEMIRTSKEHCCVRKVYILNKNKKDYTSFECIPCKEFYNLESKYKKSFNYCKHKIHHLNFYPSKSVKAFTCLEAKYIIKNFLLKTKSDIVFFKGGKFESDLCLEINVESFDMEKIGVKKVASHDPEIEVNLHYTQLMDIMFH